MLMSHRLLTQFPQSFHHLSSICIFPGTRSWKYSCIILSHGEKMRCTSLCNGTACNILQRCISQALESLLESESEWLAHGCCILDSIFAINKTCFDFGHSKHFVLPRPCLLVNTSDCSATIIDCTYGQGVGDLAKWWCHDDVI